MKKWKRMQLFSNFCYNLIKKFPYIFEHPTNGIIISNDIYGIFIQNSANTIFLSQYRYPQVYYTDETVSFVPTDNNFYSLHFSSKICFLMVEIAIYN